jgi:ketosteroid isomerase-like protein
MERKMFLGAIVVLSAMAAAFFGARQAMHSRPESAASRIAAVQREISDLQRGLHQAEAERDASGVAAFYSEDARFFPLAAEGPKLGRDQIEDFYQRTPYSAQRKLERIELQGDLAIAIGDFAEISAAGAGGEESSSGFLSIWRYNGQNWELMLDSHELRR